MRFNLRVLKHKKYLKLSNGMETIDPQCPYYAFGLSVNKSY